MITKLLIDTCGECQEYNKTKLVYSNKSNSDEFVFPVTRTSYGHSAYSKFIPVIQVPGVVVMTRKGDLSMVLTNVAGGSVLKQSWPISVITILLAMLAGIIIWLLVCTMQANYDVKILNCKIFNCFGFAILHSVIGQKLIASCTHPIRGKMQT